jgi:hypothetical protein
VSDPQAAHESWAATEQVAPAGVTDHEDGEPEASSPEPERYADNRLTDEAAAAEPGTTSLDAKALTSLRSRWREIQGQFVDEPRSAVHDADALVADLMQRLARMLAAERDQLESRWAGRTDVSTDDLRQGLQCYRSFFERLLAACPSAEPPASTAA